MIRFGHIIRIKGPYNEGFQRAKAIDLIRYPVSVHQHSTTPSQLPVHDVYTGNDATTVLNLSAPEAFRYQEQIANGQTKQGVSLVYIFPNPLSSTNFS
jgi:hypothetical protein